MEERISRLLGQIKGELMTRYGSKVEDVILYGSHARGDAEENSDVDLLVLVDDSLDPSEVRKSMSDALLDILLETGVFISVVVLPTSFFQRYHSPFVLNVNREGIKV